MPKDLAAKNDYFVFSEFQESLDDSTADIARSSSDSNDNHGDGSIGDRGWFD